MEKNKETFMVDQNYHIHTHLSKCSNDENQNIDNIVSICKKLGYKKIAITDHMWDDAIPNEIPFYEGQNLKHIQLDRPYKNYEGIKIYFGAEADMDINFNLGLSKGAIDELDFINISTTHFHIALDYKGNYSTKEKAKYWLDRINRVLDMDLPFHKIGFSHLTTGLIAVGNNQNVKEVLSYLTDDDLHKVFKRCATKGAGIELNFVPSELDDELLFYSLRVYKIAKEEGCKFYFGGDEHHPESFKRRNDDFQHIVKLLDLKESDKFIIKE